MKKSVLIMFSMILAGCGGIPDGVVESLDKAVNVNNVTVPETVKYNPSDSSFVTSIALNTNENVSGVYCQLYGPNNKQVNELKYFLKDDGNASGGDDVKGDGRYSAKIAVSKNYTNGRYLLKYYMNDASGNNYQLYSHYFQYIANSVNNAPVISDLVMPDTVKAEELFVFSVKAADAQGLNDIQRVVFKFIREDGTESLNYEMYDNGDADRGDQLAGDGIYSFKNWFSKDAQQKSRTFVFQAFDYSNAGSNIITHKIYIK